MSLKKRLSRMRERLTLKQLHRSAGLSIQALPGTGSTGVVVFGSLHGSLMDERQLEMAGTATQGNRPAVFVRDLSCGWYQDPRAGATLVDVVRAHLRREGIDRIICVGGSMGAYGAIVFARDLGAASVLAFGPQYDVAMSAVPEDPRWPEYRGKIEEFGYGALDRWLDPGVDYFVLHGMEGADIVHWSRFPVADNLHHYLMRHRWHDVPQWLKDQGRLRDCFELAVAADRAGFAALMAEVGGTRRTTETWETHPNSWFQAQMAEASA